MLKEATEYLEKMSDEISMQLLYFSLNKGCFIIKATDL